MTKLGSAGAWSNGEDLLAEEAKDELRLPGHLSHYFATESDDETCILTGARVLISAHVISVVTDFIPILAAVAREGRPLLVVAQNVTGEALSTLIENRRRGNLASCAVALGTSDQARRLRKALSRFSGARVFGDEAGLVLSCASLTDLGEVDRVSASERGTQLQRRVATRAPT